jgi:hypothetical protein
VDYRLQFIQGRRKKAECRRGRIDGNIQNPTSKERIGALRRDMGRRGSDRPTGLKIACRVPVLGVERVIFSDTTPLCRGRARAFFQTLYENRMAGKAWRLHERIGELFWGRAAISLSQRQAIQGAINK